MPRVMLAVALSGALATPAVAQEAKPSGAALVQLSTQQDHRLMMEALGIRSRREGASSQHGGGHTTGPTWPSFLAFADRSIKLKAAPAPVGAGE